jgi:tetratricopeptide (TPR) repeat protein
VTGPAWDRVKQLFEQTLEQPADSRAAFLAAACGEDAALRAEVEALVRAHDASGDFLETPAAAQIGFASPPASDNVVGRLIGPYRIVAEVGRGGMGAVYRARREGDDYTQEVALKLLPGGQTSARFAARFRQERRILASLEHPHIARLIDGGTTDDDRLYYAMEFVDGRPLDTYCEEAHLDLRARLELFGTICEGVAYAHRNLVVHRDLKPGNILVAADGSPKLLDFGIAKLLSADAAADAEQTATGMQLMTPEYASPEQVRGDPVTTATDVYALGVILYLLLTDRRPYEFSTGNTEDIVRTVCYEDPRPPSAMVGAARRQIAGDLDTIVLKALRKEPERRYKSVDELSEDVRRYLAGRTVGARPDTLRYRTTKFVTRHRGAVAGAVVTMLSLVAGLAATTYQARIAEANRQRAETRFEDLRQIARSNLFELHDAIQPLPGSATARHLLIQRSVQYLDRLNGETSGRRDLQEELAVGYQRIAQLQGNFSGPGIGDSQAALASYGKALALRDGLLAGRPRDATGLMAVSEVLREYAYTLLMTGRVAHSSRAAQRALDTAQQAVRLLPGDLRGLGVEVQAHLQLAFVFGGSGSSGSTREFSAAIDHDRRALAILARMLDAKEPRARPAAAAVQVLLGFHLQKARAFDEAARVFNAVLSDEQTRPVLAAIWLGNAYNNQGLMFERAGDQRKALEAYHVQLRLSSRIADADPSDLTNRINFAIAQAHVGMQTARLGQPAAGKRQLDDAIRMAEALLAANPSMSFYKDLLVIAYGYQAEALSMVGDQAGAEAKCRSALAMATATSRADPDDLESPLTVAKVQVALAVVLGRAARYAEAARELRAARERVSGLLRLRPDDAEAAYVSQVILDNAAALDGCTDGRACNGTSSLRLPSLPN